MRIAEIIAESVTEINHTRVWVDPSRFQLISLAGRFPLRGTVVDHHVYVWDAHSDTHYGIRSAIVGEEPDYGGDDDLVVARKGTSVDEEWFFGNEVEIGQGVYLSAGTRARQAPGLARYYRR